MPLISRFAPVIGICFLSAIGRSFPFTLVPGIPTRPSPTVATSLPIIILTLPLVPTFVFLSPSLKGVQRLTSIISASRKASTVACWNSPFASALPQSNLSFVIAKGRTACFSFGSWSETRRSFCFSFCFRTLSQPRNSCPFFFPSLCATQSKRAELYNITQRNWFLTIFNSFLL